MKVRHDRDSQYTCICGGNNAPPPPKLTSFRITGATVKGSNKPRDMPGCGKMPFSNRRDKYETGLMLLLGSKTAPVLAPDLEFQGFRQSWDYKRWRSGTSVVVSDDYLHGGLQHDLHVFHIFTLRLPPNTGMKLFLHATRWPLGSSQSGLQFQILLPT